MKRLIFGIFVVSLMFSGPFWSCKKDQLLQQSGAGLKFSVDTLLFDTIFTDKASATRLFKVFNPHNKTIEIKSIRLAGGKNSNFRMNVDGLSTRYAQNIRIRPGDSMYLFVEVTVDPNAMTNPFLITDSILFNLTDRRQRVILGAWGQNAYYYSKANLDCQTFDINGSEFVLCDLPCDVTWNTDKPHVILHNIVVDSNCYLKIKQGTNVYLHKRARIFVNGTLQVGDSTASIDDPVTIQGDRLEPFYSDKPGQWDGIHLLKSSKNNQIHNTIIKNGTVGVRVDSFSVNPPFPKLYMTNTIIKNMISTGILGVTASVLAENSLVYNCGEHNVDLALGGVYRFTHCTFVNYSNDIIEHEKPVLQASNFLKAGAGKFLGPLVADFNNCIIYGSRDSSEVALTEDKSAQFEVTFDHCLMKIDKKSSKATYNSIIKDKDPEFEDINENDYHLQSSSPAVDAGKKTGLQYDLENNMRDNNPDIGAYEFN